MYEGGPQPGANGQLIEPDRSTKINYRKGAVLLHWHEKLRPSLSIETGLAYGYSTLFVLGAMKRDGYGHHIALDPFQDAYGGVGAQHAVELGVGDRFTHLVEDSATALGRMAAEGKRIQWLFVDGDHRFDGALLDFTMGARMLDVGGVIIVDDLWMKSVAKAVKFVRRNRPDFVEEPAPASLGVFRKVAEDTREWTHFRPF